MWEAARSPTTRDPPWPPSSARDPPYLASPDRHTMDDELVRVTRLLRPMSLEAGPLMDLVRQARGRGSCTLPPGAGVVGRGTSGGGGRQQQQQAVVLEEEAVMRVLARRPERMGSKLLKEEYKMSKRLKA